MKQSVCLIILMIMSGVVFADSDQVQGEDRCIKGAALFDYEFVEYNESGCTIDDNGTIRNMYRG